MRKKGMDTIFISDDGVKDDTFIKVAGEYAEGVYATGPMDTSENPMTIEAEKEYRDTYKEDPGTFFLNAYSASIALLNAIEKSGSTKYEDIVNALRTENVATPIGLIRFDERGDAIGIGFVMYRVKDGVYTQAN
jgi:branched-chain amino acid transport system substrate-binding protein